MRKFFFLFTSLTMLTSIGVAIENAICPGDVDMQEYIRVTLDSENYVIPQDNVSEGGGFLSGLFRTQPEASDELLLKFDGQTLQDLFGVGFQSEKLFVVEGGDRAERSKADSIQRAHDVLFDGSEYLRRVVEFVPELDVYRVFRNDTITMFWDLSTVNPLEVKREDVNENSVIAACSSRGGENACAFGFYFDGYVVRHNMPEQYAPLNSKISKFVIQRLQAWKELGRNFR